MLPGSHESARLGGRIWRAASDKARPWTYGVRALTREMATRGLI